MLNAFLINLGLGWLFVIVMMTLVFVVAKLVKNATVVDLYWGFSFIVLSGFYYAMGVFGEAPFALSQGLMLLVVVVAGLRLGFHIASRVIQEHPKEDPRYTSFREHFSEHPEIATYLAFQLQGALMVLASIPLLLVYMSTLAVNAVFIVGLMLSLIGVVGEMVADYQLKSYISKPNNKGKTCTVGLWNYSRHPNYFFQWLIWCGYAVMALQAPLGWLGMLSPILMLHFLVNITGIKATEERAILSREGYREYQQSTSAFVPLPKGVTF